MVDSYDTLWEKAASNIELEVSKANYNTWFKDLYITKIDNGSVYLAVPNQFVKNWLSEKFEKMILKNLIAIDDTVRNIDFHIEKREKRLARAEKRANSSATNRLPLDNLYINKSDNLNPRYTFDTFVVGDFNEVAYSAAQAVIKRDDIVYNPLFVYGNTGHGKTHLIQAIGNHIKKEKPEKRVYYLTTDKFQMEVVEQIGKSNRANEFKNKYRKYDVLIIDDIHFLSKKEKTQEELFHLFNYLYDNNKQMILSSDKHPNQIPDIEDRLRSRFNAGMNIDIQAPGYEARVQIIKKKSEASNFGLSDKVIEFLASTVTGNIRELEGVFNSVVLKSDMKGREITLAEAKDLVKNNIKKRKVLRVEEVVKLVSDYYEIDESNVYKKIRKKEFVKPRQLIMYILREDFQISFPTIGEKLGGRDHTTVMHSCDKVREGLEENPQLVADLEAIRSMF
tara:strand:+ start:424 stop:1773 length:1350 start_codon:yes stop_codon:yes gene_type:complete